MVWSAFKYSCHTCSSSPHPSCSLNSVSNHVGSVAISYCIPLGHNTYTYSHIGHSTHSTILTITILRPHALHPSRKPPTILRCGFCTLFLRLFIFFNFLRHCDVQSFALFDLFTSVCLFSRPFFFYIYILLFFALAPFLIISVRHRGVFFLNYSYQKTPNIQFVLTLVLFFSSLHISKTMMLQQRIRNYPPRRFSFFRRVTTTATPTTTTAVVGLAAPARPTFGYTPRHFHSSYNPSTNSYSRPASSSPLPRRLFLDRQCHGP